MDKDGQAENVSGFLGPLRGAGVLDPLLYSAGALVVVASVLTAVTPLIASSAFSLALAIFIYLIVPGYCVLLNFELDGVERILLGIPVSAALLPILHYLLNQAGLLITPLTTFLLIAAISGGGVALRVFAAKRRKDG